MCSSASNACTANARSSRSRVLSLNLDGKWKSFQGGTGKGVLCCGNKINIGPNQTHYNTTQYPHALCRQIHTSGRVGLRDSKGCRREDVSSYRLKLRRIALPLPIHARARECVSVYISVDPYTTSASLLCFAKRLVIFPSVLHYLNRKPHIHTLTYRQCKPHLAKGNGNTKRNSFAKWISCSISSSFLWRRPSRSCTTGREERPFAGRAGNFSYLDAG